ncbi:MAG: transcriptional repressor NrdR [Chloroflexi bacterium]|nr:transcriptional repressor NrdR [Chloroflexota bacterium]
MRCPFCQGNESRVIESRETEDCIRRRRECLDAACAGRFTTYERVQAVAVYVVKKDGRREEFSREKLLSGLRKACEKRPLTASVVDDLATEIESRLYESSSAEVRSSDLGEIVMERLRALDPIAYVRFASVYRSFADLDALRDELERLAEHRGAAQAQLPLPDEAYSPTLRLRPAAPTVRARTRRPVRPVQTPVSITEQASAPREPSKRQRRAK